MDTWISSTTAFGQVIQDSNVQVDISGGGDYTGRY